MADLLSKLRMLDAAPKRPAPAAREAQEGCYRSQATFPLSIFTDLRHLTPAVMESAFGLPFPPDLCPEDILFLDTETTGLAGGAGTVAFLVGLGYFTGGGFAVEQVLMRDYGQESELLRTVSSVAGRFTALCTFNGRTFDAPLLASRFVMHRISARLPDVHADVLYPARRLWKLRLKSCTLSNLEEQLLHVKREDDLPGAEVPQTYFRYLRDGDFAPIERILAHNRQDIVSLAQLLCFLCGQVDCPETVKSGQDLLSLARSLERRGDTARAVKCYRLCARGETRAEAFRALAQAKLEKAQRDRREAKPDGAAQQRPQLHPAREAVAQKQAREEARQRQRVGDGRRAHKPPVGQLHLDPVAHGAVGLQADGTALAPAAARAALGARVGPHVNDGGFPGRFVVCLYLAEFDHLWHAS